MTATGLSGRSVFLVEDEVMIRMMVADIALPRLNCYRILSRCLT